MSRPDTGSVAPPFIDPHRPGQTLATHPGKVALLRDMPIFGAVPERALAWLSEHAEHVAVSAGDWFFHQGEPGDTMYVLRSGQVQVHRAADGQSRIIGTLSAGDCFGEMALIDLYPRSAGVRAAEDCVAMGLGHALLYQLYALDPEPFTLIMMNLARELSRRLRRTEAQLFRHDLPTPQDRRRPPPAVAETPYV